MLALELTLTQRVCMVPVLVLLGYAIIKIRIGQVMVTPVLAIKNPYTIMFYINKLEDDFKNDSKVHSYLFLHMQHCNALDCFCRTSKEALQGRPGGSSVAAREVLNQVFEQCFRKHKWPSGDRYLLVHWYARFLMRNKQYLRAINLLSHLDVNQMGFFCECYNFVLKAELLAKYQKDVYFDSLGRMMELIGVYDVGLGYVNKEIREVLKNKIEFWEEMCKEAPLLSKLEVQGRLLVSRIEALHSYFMCKIKPQEEFLSHFNCTILYCTYLILTTNYS